MHCSPECHLETECTPLQQGMAPTIMVARVNLAASEADLWPRTRQSTELRFHSQAKTADESGTQAFEGEDGTEKSEVEHDGMAET